MEVPILVLVVTFFVLLVAQVPIAVGIGLSTALTLAIVGSIPTATIIAQRTASGIETFSLLAIPFFVLSGILMSRGGIARRLMALASTLLGRFRGGLAYVNVLSCMMIGALSGSAVAAISSVGGFMIPSMSERGYHRPFAVAVTTTAATTGLLIPPSNIMIVYALVSGGVSVAALFLAGVLPGILTGIAIMVAAGIISAKRGYGAGEKSSLKDFFRALWDALLSLSLIILVMWGILNGVFTPTEAAAIAVVYSFILAVLVYREIKFAELPGILLETGLTTSVVMILIGTSQALSWLLAYEHIPQTISMALIGISDNPVVILIIINLVLLIVGTFMDMTPAVLIFTPIFLPVVRAMGMHPVHFGIIMIANLCIGLCTPPVGSCLFVGCGVGGISIAKATLPMVPFWIAMTVALLLITYLPWLSLWLPSLAGLL